MKSIQTKFIILILGCVLLSSLVIGGGGILNAQSAVDTNSAQIMNLQCSERAWEFDSLLSRIEQSVKTLSVYSLTELESVARLKADEEYLADYTRRLEAAAVNAANNTEGALAVYVRFNPEFAPPTSGLFWSKTNLNGQFQQLVPTDFSNYSPSDVERVGWYYIPVQSGKPIWMEPYHNQNVNVRMISYVIPLYKDNQTVGVVGMDIDFSVFETIASEVSVYQTGYAFLSNEQGEVMYHPQHALGTKLSAIEPSMLELSTEMKNGSSGSNLFSYKKDGQSKKMAYRTLQNNMRLAICAPLGEIDAVKNKLVVNSLLALVVMASLSVFLTVLMTRRLVRPLRELNEAAKKIAAGDLSISLTQPSKDEVGMLADSFQQTVNHLQKYINHINGLAYRDALTGTKNKTAYQETARKLDEKMRLERPEYALVVADINGLKLVNDRYGHDFGDMLLIDACKLICKTFQHSPVYRIGGDEFVVILEQGDYDHYAQLMEDFRTELEAYNSTARPDSRLSIARGIAVYNSDSDLVFANVFKRADDAMYQNKLAMKVQATAEAEQAADSNQV